VLFRQPTSWRRSFFAEMRSIRKIRTTRIPIVSCSRKARRAILYAAWPERAHSIRADLPESPEVDSDLEGHPTPGLPFVDVATGSLGQGICAAIARR